MTHIFRHPKYYKELRKQYRDSQVVNQVKLSSQSQAPSTPAGTAEAPSSKLQASSTKRFKLQAASFKPQAASFKLQA